MKKRAAESTAAQVRDRVRNSSDRFWEISEFDGDPHPVAMELKRLTDVGELERVRRGVYWRGRSTGFGPTLPPAIEAARKILSSREAVGAAEWYAANQLGLSTQVSPRPVVAVTRRAPSGLKGIEFVDRSSRIGRRDENLNSLEVTFLEALSGWDRYVELSPESAVERFIQILKSPEIRLKKLVRASKTEPASTRERLRAILMIGGWTEEADRVERARSKSSRNRALSVVPETLL